MGNGKVKTTIGNKRLAPLAQNAQINTSIEYLTRKQVSNILNISLVTVDKWAAIGLLKSYRLGTRVFFKRHELDAALTVIPSKNKGA